MSEYVGKIKALEDLEENISRWAAGINPNIADDLAQEMRLAILEAKDGATMAYYRGAMFCRAKDMIRKNKCHDKLKDFLLKHPAISRAAIGGVWPN